MTEGHIYIQGEITSWQDSEAELWGEVNVKNVTRQIQDNSLAEKLIVHIHSPGGDVDEGFAIHDLIKNTGKEIKVIIEGLCASIATVIAMAGDEREMTENSTFLIHNPWTWGAGGEAKDLEKQAEELRKIEAKILDFYVAKTGADSETLKAYMDQETTFTAEQAKELGFITSVKSELKAVAKYSKFNNQKNDKMNEEKLNGIQKMLKEIKNMLPGRAKNVILTDADGKQIEFTSGEVEQGDVKVGSTAVWVDGGAPDGDVIMADGTVFVFENGTVTEIKEPMPNEGEEMEALKAENENLKSEIETLKAQNSKAEDKLNTFAEELTSIKASIKSNNKTFGPDGKHDEKTGGDNLRIKKINRN